MKANIKPGRIKITTIQGLLPRDVLNKTFLAEKFKEIKCPEGTGFNTIVSITRYKGPMVWAVNSKDLVFLDKE